MDPLLARKAAIVGSPMLRFPNQTDVETINSDGRFRLDVLARRVPDLTSPPIESKLPTWARHILNRLQVSATRFSYLNGFFVGGRKVARKAVHTNDPDGKRGGCCQAPCRGEGGGRSYRGSGRGHGGVPTTTE